MAYVRACAPMVGGIAAMNYVYYRALRSIGLVPSLSSVLRRKG